MDYQSKIDEYKHMIEELEEVPEDLRDYFWYTRNWMAREQLYLTTFMSCSQSGTYTLEDLQLRKTILAVLEKEKDEAKALMDAYHTEHPLEDSEIQ